MEAVRRDEIPQEMVGMVDGVARKEKPRRHDFVSRTLVSFFKVLEMAGCSAAGFTCWDDIQGRPVPMTRGCTLLFRQF